MKRERKRDKERDKETGKESGFLGEGKRVFGMRFDPRSFHFLH